MFGNSKRQTTWYACAPKKAWRPDGHPVILRVREDHLLDGLTQFLSEKVVGPHRRALLDTHREALAQVAQQAQASKAAAPTSSATSKNAAPNCSPTAPIWNVSSYRQMQHHPDR